MDKAACGEVGRNLKRNAEGKPIDPFFPERGESKSDGPMTCFKCPVTKQCEIYRIEIGAKVGVWGGKNQK